MANRYSPPTRVVTTSTPYLALVTAADPQWASQKFREVFYEFTGHAIIGFPYACGPYDGLSGTYPVGQARGAPDPLIAAAKAPTAGCPTPGLYQGTDDGKGWA